MSETITTLLEKGNKALAGGDTLVALMQFETAHAIEQRPVIKSKLAYCLAIERRQYQQAMRLCREALELDPGNPEHYYQLGRIYIAAGQKKQAITTLRKGLKFKRHQGIIDELTKLGARKPVVFSSLPREHILNRSAGFLLSKLGTR